MLMPLLFSMTYSTLTFTNCSEGSCTKTDFNGLWNAKFDKKVSSSCGTLQYFVEFTNGEMKVRETL